MAEEVLGDHLMGVAGGGGGERGPHAQRRQSVEGALVVEQAERGSARHGEIRRGRYAVRRGAAEAGRRGGRGRCSSGDREGERRRREHAEAVVRESRHAGMHFASRGSHTSNR